MVGSVGYPVGLYVPSAMAAGPTATASKINGILPQSLQNPFCITPPSKCVFLRRSRRIGTPDAAQTDKRRSHSHATGFRTHYVTTDKLCTCGSVVISGTFDLRLNNSKNLQSRLKSRRPCETGKSCKGQTPLTSRMPRTSGPGRQYETSRRIASTGTKRGTASGGRCPSALLALGDQRRDAKVASSLFHQLFEATARSIPEFGFERYVARSQGTALILARPFTTATLAATIVVHLAGMIAGRRAHTHARALVAAIHPLAATRVKTAAHVRLG
jgi:hypothetical protein